MPPWRRPAMARGAETMAADTLVWGLLAPARDRLISWRRTSQAGACCALDCAAGSPAPPPAKLCGSSYVTTALLPERRWLARPPTPACLPSPECRARARTPHVNISLLRTLRAPPPAPSASPAAAGGSGGVLTRRQRQQLEQAAAGGEGGSADSAEHGWGGAQQQQQQQQQQQSPVDLILGAGRGGGGGSEGGGNPLAAAVALAATVHGALRQRGSGAAADPEVAAWKVGVGGGQGLRHRRVRKQSCWSKRMGQGC
jgi:hypothetical protein